MFRFNCLSPYVCPSLCFCVLACACLCLCIGCFCCVCLLVLSGVACPIFSSPLVVFELRLGDVCFAFVVAAAVVLHIIYYCNSLCTAHVSQLAVHQQSLILMICNCQGDGDCSMPSGNRDEGCTGWSFIASIETMVPLDKAIIGRLIGISDISEIGSWCCYWCSLGISIL